MNKRIRFARGIRSKILASEVVPADGQPVYNKTDNTLLIGDGVKQLKALSNLTVTDVKNSNGDVTIESTNDGVSISALGDITIHSADNLSISAENSSSIAIEGDLSLGGTSTTIDNLYLKVVGDNIGNTVSISQMESNAYYVCPSTNLTSLTISSLKAGPSGTVGEYVVEFTASSTSITVTLPSSVKYANGWTATDFEVSTKYTIYILNNVAYVSFIEG